jgi:hypothetical protein
MYFLLFYHEKKKKNRERENESKGEKTRLPSGEMKWGKNPRRISCSPTKSLMWVFFFW